MAIILQINKLFINDIRAAEALKGLLPQKIYMRQNGCVENFYFGSGDGKKAFF